MAAEAQRIMTVSLKKIVESRSKRGGVSLHRNLLIAGVLFKARDVMLAEQTRTVNPVSCMRQSEPVVQQEATSTDVDQPMEDDSSPCIVAESAAEVPEVQSLPTPVVESTVSMDWSDVETPPSSDSKENIPPPNQAPAPLPSTDVATRGVKRQNVTSSDDDVSLPPCKSPRFEDTEHCVPDISSSQSVDCKSRSTKTSRTGGSSRTAKKRDQSVGTGHYQPVVCLPRVEVKSTPCWSSLVRPIFVVQVV